MIGHGRLAFGRVAGGRATGVLNGWSGQTFVGQRMRCLFLQKNDSRLSLWVGMPHKRRGASSLFWLVEGKPSFCAPPCGAPQMKILSGGVDCFKKKADATPDRDPNAQNHSEPAK